MTISIGILADPQYADCDDGAQYGDPSRVRRYRASLDIIEDASKTFSTLGTTVNVVLGDILDGKCRKGGYRDAAMTSILERIEKHTPSTHSTDNAADPWAFVVGNHDFYNYTRDEIYNDCKYFVPKQAKQECSPSKLYYSYAVSPRLRMIVLDSYEFSMDGGVDEAAKTAAEALVSQMNPNYGHSPNWLEGLEEQQKRYVPYNGGMGEGQIQWLASTLQACQAAGQKVIVFSHSPLVLHERLCRGSGVCWSGAEISTMLRDSGVCLAVFTGHDHDGGYYCEGGGGGIRHVVPPAPLEAPAGSQAFGVLHVDVEGDKVRWDWKGEYPRELRLALERGEKGREQEKAFWDGAWW
jgi:manganese-dependent ADP-ribose/CDP-alcohol diphosphatase